MFCLRATRDHKADPRFYVPPRLANFCDVNFKRAAGDIPTLMEAWALDGAHGTFPFISACSIVSNTGYLSGAALNAQGHQQKARKHLRGLIAASLSKCSVTAMQSIANIHPLLEKAAKSAVEIQMHYDRFYQLIVVDWEVDIIGWPQNIPFIEPGRLSSPDLQTITAAFESRPPTITFVKLTPEQVAVKKAQHAADVNAGITPALPGRRVEKRRKKSKFAPAISAEEEGLLRNSTSTSAARSTPNLSAVLSHSPSLSAPEQAPQTPSNPTSSSPTSPIPTPPSPTPPSPTPRSPTPRSPTPPRPVASLSSHEPLERPQFTQPLPPPLPPPPPPASETERQNAIRAKERTTLAPAVEASGVTLAQAAGTTVPSPLSDNQAGEALLALALSGASETDTASEEPTTTATTATAKAKAKPQPKPKGRKGKAAGDKENEPPAKPANKRKAAADESGTSSKRRKTAPVPPVPDVTAQEPANANEDEDEASSLTKRGTKRRNAGPPLRFTDNAFYDV